MSNNSITIVIIIIVIIIDEVWILTRLFHYLISSSFHFYSPSSYSLSLHSTKHLLSRLTFHREVSPGWGSDLEKKQLQLQHG